MYYIYNVYIYIHIYIPIITGTALPSKVFRALPDQFQVAFCTAQICGDQ